MKTPNPDVLTDTYNLLTDGKGMHHKMPTIAEFMSIYKEREKQFIRRQNLQISEEFPSTIKPDPTHVRNIIKKLTSGTRVNTNLCSFPHDFREKVKKEELLEMIREETGFSTFRMLRSLCIERKR